MKSLLSLAALSLLATPSIAASFTPAPAPHTHGASGTSGEKAFGFSSFEIYSFDAGVFDLCQGDFNGDQRTDLALVNNARSRVDVLLRLAADSPAWVDPRADEEQSNRVRFDGRYEITELASERRVLQLCAGDFNGDGQDELAYATPGYLHVHSAAATSAKSDSANATAKSWKRKFDELARECRHLSAVDLDGDGRQDLLALGIDSLFWLRSLGDKSFAAAETLDHFSERVQRIFARDLNGDGTTDLAFLLTNERHPLRFRLNTGDADTLRFGPRYSADLAQVRTGSLMDWNADGRAELLAVHRNSGRVASYTLEPQNTSEDSDSSKLARFAIRAGADREAASRAYGIGDLDGDGSSDLLVADASSARLFWFRQNSSDSTKSGQLTSVSFPSLVGAIDPRVGDLNGDGQAELVVISGSEKLLGFCSPQASSPSGNGSTKLTLPFPSLRPVDGEPLAMDLRDLNNDGFDDAVVVVSQGEGRKRAFSLQFWFGSAEGLAGDPLVQTLKSIKRSPSSLRCLDMNGDQRLDLVLFPSSESGLPHILVQSETEANGQLRWLHDERGEQAPGLGILKGAKPRHLSAADTDGDGSHEVLVSSANFARSLLFEASRSKSDSKDNAKDDSESEAAGGLSQGSLMPRVLAQFNGPSVDAAIDGALSLDLNQDGRNEVVLLDRQAQELLVYGLGSDTSGSATDSLQLIERMDVSRLDLVDLQSADVNGDGQQDIVLMGVEQFAVAFNSANHWKWSEQSSFEPEKANVSLGQIIGGDWNGDGQMDLALVENARDSLVFLDRRNDELHKALAFRVFERTEMNTDTGSSLRELLSADCNSDGKDDLALLVHEKLIVYLQE